MSTVYKGAPNLKLNNLSGATQAIAITMTSLVVAVLSLLFWLPYVYAKVVRKDYSEYFSLPHHHCDNTQPSDGTTSSSALSCGAERPLLPFLRMSSSVMSPTTDSTTETFRRMISPSAPTDKVGRGLEMGDHKLIDQKLADRNRRSTPTLLMVLPKPEMAILCPRSLLTLSKSPLHRSRVHGSTLGTFGSLLDTEFPEL